MSSVPACIGKERLAACLGVTVPHPTFALPVAAGGLPPCSTCGQVSRWEGVRGWMDEDWASAQPLLDTWDWKAPHGRAQSQALLEAQKENPTPEGGEHVLLGEARGESTAHHHNTARRTLHLEVKEKEGRRSRNSGNRRRPRGLVGVSVGAAGSAHAQDESPRRPCPALQDALVTFLPERTAPARPSTGSPGPDCTSHHRPPPREAEDHFRPPASSSTARKPGPFPGPGAPSLGRVNVRSRGRCRWRCGGSGGLCGWGAPTLACVALAAALKRGPCRHPTSQVRNSFPVHAATSGAGLGLPLAPEPGPPLLGAPLPSLVLSFLEAPWGSRCPSAKCVCPLMRQLHTHSVVIKRLLRACPVSGTVLSQGQKLLALLELREPLHPVSEGWDPGCLSRGSRGGPWRALFDRLRRARSGPSGAGIREPEKRQDVARPAQHATSHKKNLARAAPGDSDRGVSSETGGRRCPQREPPRREGDGVQDGAKPSGVACQGLPRCRQGCRSRALLVWAPPKTLGKALPGSRPDWDCCQPPHAARLHRTPSHGRATGVATASSRPSSPPTAQDSVTEVWATGHLPHEQELWSSALQTLEAAGLRKGVTGFRTPPTIGNWKTGPNVPPLFQTLDPGGELAPCVQSTGRVWGPSGPPGFTELQRPGLGLGRQGQLVPESTQGEEKLSSDLDTCLPHSLENKTPRPSSERQQARGSPHPARKPCRRRAGFPVPAACCCRGLNYGLPVKRVLHTLSSAPPGVNCGLMLLSPVPVATQPRITPVPTSKRSAESDGAHRQAIRQRRPPPAGLAFPLRNPPALTQTRRPQGNPCLPPAAGRGPLRVALPTKGRVHQGPASQPALPPYNPGFEATPAADPSTGPAAPGTGRAAGSELRGARCRPLSPPRLLLGFSAATGLGNTQQIIVAKFPAPAPRRLLNTRHRAALVTVMPRKAGPGHAAPVCGWDRGSRGVSPPSAWTLRHTPQAWQLRVHPPGTCSQWGRLEGCSVQMVRSRKGCDGHPACRALRAVLTRPQAGLGAALPRDEAWRQDSSPRGVFCSKRMAWVEHEGRRGRPGGAARWLSLLRSSESRRGGSSWRLDWQELSRLSIQPSRAPPPLQVLWSEGAATGLRSLGVCEETRAHETPSCEAPTGRLGLEPPQGTRLPAELSPCLPVSEQVTCQSSGPARAGAPREPYLPVAPRPLGSAPRRALFPPPSPSLPRLCCSRRPDIPPWQRVPTALRPFTASGLASEPRLVCPAFLPHASPWGGALGGGGRATAWGRLFLPAKEAYSHKRKPEPRVSHDQSQLLRHPLRAWHRNRHGPCAGQHLAESLTGRETCPTQTSEAEAFPDHTARAAGAGAEPAQPAKLRHSFSWGGGPLRVWAEPVDMPGHRCRRELMLYGTGGSADVSSSEEGRPRGPDLIRRLWGSVRGLALGRACGGDPRVASRGSRSTTTTKQEPWPFGCKEVNFADVLRYLTEVGSPSGLLHSRAPSEGPHHVRWAAWQWRRPARAGTQGCGPGPRAARSAADLCKMAMIRIFTAVAASPTLTARSVSERVASPPGPSPAWTHLPQCSGVLSCESAGPVPCMCLDVASMPPPAGGPLGQAALGCAWAAKDSLSLRRGEVSPGCLVQKCGSPALLLVHLDPFWCSPRGTMRSCPPRGGQGRPCPAASPGRGPLSSVSASVAPAVHILNAASPRPPLCWPIATPPGHPRGWALLRNPGSLPGGSPGRPLEKRVRQTPEGLAPSLPGTPRRDMALDGPEWACPAEGPFVGGQCVHCEEEELSLPSATLRRRAHSPSSLGCGTCRGASWALFPTPLGQRDLLAYGRLSHLGFRCSCAFSGHTAFSFAGQRRRKETGGAAWAGPRAREEGQSPALGPGLPALLWFLLWFLQTLSRRPLAGFLPPALPAAAPSPTCASQCHPGLFMAFCWGPESVVSVGPGWLAILAVRPRCLVSGKSGVDKEADVRLRALGDTSYSGIHASWYLPGAPWLKHDTGRLEAPHPVARRAPTGWSRRAAPPLPTGSGRRAGALLTLSSAVAQRAHPASQQAVSMGGLPPFRHGISTQGLCSYQNISELERSLEDCWRQHLSKEKGTEAQSTMCVSRFAQSWTSTGPPASGSSSLPRPHVGDLTPPASPEDAYCAPLLLGTGTAGPVQGCLWNTGSSADHTSCPLPLTTLQYTATRGHLPQKGADQVPRAQERQQDQPGSEDRAWTSRDRAAGREGSATSRPCSQGRWEAYSPWPEQVDGRWDFQGQEDHHTGPHLDGTEGLRGLGWARLRDRAPEEWWGDSKSMLTPALAIPLRCPQGRGAPPPAGGQMKMDSPGSGRHPSPPTAPLAQVLWSRVVGAWLVCRELIRLAMKAGSPIQLGTAGSGCPCVTGWVGPQPLDTIVAGMGPGQPRRRAGEGDTCTSRQRRWGRAKHLHDGRGVGLTTSPPGLEGAPGLGQQGLGPHAPVLSRWVLMAACTRAGGARTGGHGCTDHRPQGHKEMRSMVLGGLLCQPVWDRGMAVTSAVHSLPGKRGSDTCVHLPTSGRLRFSSFPVPQFPLSNMVMSPDPTRGLEVNLRKRVPGCRPNFPEAAPACSGSGTSLACGLIPMRMCPAGHSSSDSKRWVGSFPVARVQRPQWLTLVRGPSGSLAVSSWCRDGGGNASDQNASQAKGESGGDGKVSPLKSLPGSWRVYASGGWERNLIHPLPNHKERGRVGWAAPTLCGKALHIFGGRQHNPPPPSGLPSPPLPCRAPPLPASTVPAVDRQQDDKDQTWPLPSKAGSHKEQRTRRPPLEGCLAAFAVGCRPSKSSCGSPAPPPLPALQGEPPSSTPRRGWDQGWGHSPSSCHLHEACKPTETPPSESGDLSSVWPTASFQSRSLECPLLYPCPRRTGASAHLSLSPPRAPCPSAVTLLPPCLLPLQRPRPHLPLPHLRQEGLRGLREGPPMEAGQAEEARMSADLSGLWWSPWASARGQDWLGGRVSQGRKRPGGQLRGPVSRTSARSVVSTLWDEVQSWPGAHVPPWLDLVPRGQPAPKSPSGPPPRGGLRGALFSEMLNPTTSPAGSPLPVTCNLCSPPGGWPGDGGPGSPPPAEPPPPEHLAPGPRRPGQPRPPHLPLCRGPVMPLVGTGAERWLPPPPTCLPGWLPRFTMSCSLKWRILRFLSLQSQSPSLPPTVSPGQGLQKGQPGLGALERPGWPHPGQQLSGAPGVLRGGIGTCQASGSQACGGIGVAEARRLSTGSKPGPRPALSDTSPPAVGSLKPEATCPPTQSSGRAWTSSLTPIPWAGGPLSCVSGKSRSWKGPGPAMPWQGLWGGLEVGRSQLPSDAGCALPQPHHPLPFRELPSEMVRPLNHLTPPCPGRHHGQGGEAPCGSRRDTGASWPPASTLEVPPALCPESSGPRRHQGQGLAAPSEMLGGQGTPASPGTLPSWWRLATVGDPQGEPWARGQLCSTVTALCTVVTWGHSFSQSHKGTHRRTWRCLYTQCIPSRVRGAKKQLDRVAGAPPQGSLRAQQAKSPGRHRPLPTARPRSHSDRPRPLPPPVSICIRRERSKAFRRLLALPWEPQGASQLPWGHGGPRTRQHLPVPWDKPCTSLPLPARLPSFPGPCGDQAPSPNLQCHRVALTTSPPPWPAGVAPHPPLLPAPEPSGQRVEALAGTCPACLARPGAAEEHVGVEAPSSLGPTVGAGLRQPSSVSLGHGQWELEWARGPPQGRVTVWSQEIGGEPGAWGPSWHQPHPGRLRLPPLSCLCPSPGQGHHGVPEAPAGRGAGRGGSWAGHPQPGQAAPSCALTARGRGGERSPAPQGQKSQEGTTAPPPPPAALAPRLLPSPICPAEEPGYPLTSCGPLRGLAWGGAHQTSKLAAPLPDSCLVTLRGAPGPHQEDFWV
ncbi:hypothetical protein Cadr_000002375 [Camelus dromedarius]|uniref:Uncharacterized protein n=1 Tax=Camelus dromedarius TaxID=9838 RepID=A0A5N4EFQ0_CAMDR|nr:hypothetical protein Cadr_000002375 [Camelus dromedarius]